MGWFKMEVARFGRLRAEAKRAQTGLCVVCVVLVFFLAAVRPALSSTGGSSGETADAVGESRGRAAESSAAAASSRLSEPSEARTPSLVGLTVEEAYDELRKSGFSGRPALVKSRYIASNSVPAGVVVAQDIPPGTVAMPSTAVPIEVSAGGPAVDLQQLPVSTQQVALTLAGFDPEELILVVDTIAGTAFKTDAWLFGPCPAVDAAYRTFPDPEYGTSCEIAPSALPRTG
jgi:hypothetical protein